jgi:hypothetical protein
MDAKTNYDGDGFCGFSPKNYPEINDAEPLAKTNYDGGSLFDGNIINLRVIFRGKTTKTITIIVSLCINLNVIIRLFKNSVYN